MPNSETLLKELNSHVARMQTIIDTNEALGEYAYVNDPFWHKLRREEKALRDAYNQAWKEEYNEKVREATGLKPGDRVSYFSLSWTGMGASTWYGSIVMYRGKLTVKADELIDGKRYFQVNKGWKKITSDLKGSCHAIAGEA